MAVSDIQDPKSVTRAMEECDSLGREAFLAKYGFREARSYFLEDRGNLYDSKAIIGAAHGFELGTPLTSDEFSGGEQTVQRKLEELGFKVVVDIAEETRSAEDLQLGEILTNQEIVKIFHVGNMGGMRRSVAKGHLVIVSDHTKSLYDDRWEGDVLHYTGMGKIGDQGLTSQNRTLIKSSDVGTMVYLFEVFDPGKYVFHGEVRIASYPYQETQLDENGDPRQVWMFPVRLVSIDYVPLPSSNDLTAVRNLRQKKLSKLSLDELRKRAALASKKPPRRTTQSEQISRDEAVATYVKTAADGNCGLCSESAPFNSRNGDPYLECHHVDHLAKGGDDTIENAVALCPNCHRKMHVLDHASDRKKLLNTIAKREADFKRGEV